MVKPFSLKIAKPWGYEILLSPPESPVTAKISHLNAGCRFSLQYHDVKEETLTLIRGEAKIIIGEQEEIMVKDRGYFIPKGMIHRCAAVTDCDIFEASTPEVGTTVRLQDDYGRKDENCPKR